jgi:RND family efflux transporter MFP subunit
VAPAGGVVLRKLAEKDEQVSAGQTVLVVGGAAGGWIVRSGLADRDAMRVHLGDLAGIEFDAWPGRTWSGRVSNIAAAADPATGTFAVEVSLEPAGGGTGVAAGFAQGLVARVSLRPRQAAPAVLVPVQALLEANEREAGILVLDRGRGTVRRVNIQIGRMSGGAVEVPGGLDAGTEVVIDGAAFLENGDPVRVVAP